ncbi:hypothetical protein [Marivita sp. XM-24bin2]|jgi:hypothetical protein|uniref:hypothetical protein n=1 Tax=Marivita sp. XM-24bin2 TaxID=2133951 RepID=UPI0025B9AEAE|nr:hypothetical protein [Marivita sp. XM-24bin2]
MSRTKMKTQILGMKREARRYQSQGGRDARQYTHYTHHDRGLALPRQLWRNRVIPVSLRRDGCRRALKVRPCLLLDIDKRGGQRFALIAYGTTSRRGSNIDHEVHVRRRADYVAAGLNEPTRFVGAHRVFVPLSHSGFVICGATGSLVLGRLAGSPLDALNAVRGRIHAMQDMAEVRREIRRSISLAESGPTGVRVR